MEWRKRADLNWCYFCWFGADIESKDTEIAEIFLCHNCGARVSTYHGEQNHEAPRFFTNKEWDEFWKDNYKEINNETIQEDEI